MASTLNDFNYTDKVDDVLAVHVNSLLAATLRSEYSNTETISATKELADSDTPIQILTPSGDQDVELAPESATTNHLTFISNPASSSDNLVVKDDAGTTTFVTLPPGGWCLAKPDGTRWAVSSSQDIANNEQYGGRIVWDSTTGYHVEPGQRNVNGDVLTWTSNITRSGLSLTASTYYYSYLYDNSGTPALEESTTVPVWNSNYRYWQETGDATRRFMGGFYTDSSSDINRFTSTLNGDNLEVLYKTFLVEVNNVSSSDTWTSIDLTGSIPAVAPTHWNVAAIAYFTSTGDDGIVALAPFDQGADTASSGMYSVRTPYGRAAGSAYFGRYWLPIETSLTSYYRTQDISVSTTSVKAIIRCQGYRVTI